MSRISCVLIALLIGLIIWMSSQGQTKAQNSKETDVSDFGPGILVLMVRPNGLESKGSGIAITDAKLVRMGDRYFVRGKVYIDKSHPDVEYQKGMVSGIDW